MAPDSNNNNQVQSKQCSANEQDPSSAINKFRTAIEKSSILRSHKFDDKFLLKFLRARNFDVTRTLDILEGYISKLNNRSDLFTWEPKTAKEALGTSVFSYFLDGTTDGRQIFFLHPGRWNPKEVNLETIISLVVLCQEITLLNEEVQKAGVVVIIDMTGLSLNHLYKCGITNAKLISELTDHCIPINIINIHVVFQNWLTEMGYNLFKPFLDEEMRRKIIFHGYNTGSIHQYCPKSVLPVKYGGTHDEADVDQLFQVLSTESSKMLSIWNKYKSSNIIV